MFDEMRSCAVLERGSNEISLGVLEEVESGMKLSESSWRDGEGIESFGER
jgi:hypothetical protein